MGDQLDHIWAQLRPLKKLEALVGIDALGIDTALVWSAAGHARAPYFVAIDTTRVGYYGQLLTFALFAIAGGRADFLARRLSRSNAGQSAVLDSAPFEPQLLQDTTHQAARVISDYLGRPLVEAEKATLFVTLWRDAHGAPPTARYLADHEQGIADYAWLEQLVRESRINLRLIEPQANLGALLSTLLGRRGHRLAVAWLGHSEVPRLTTQNDVWRALLATNCQIVLNAGHGHRLEQAKDLAGPEAWLTAMPQEMNDGQAMLDGLSEATRRLMERALSGGANDDALWPEWCERLLGEPEQGRALSAQALAFALGI